MHLPLQARLFGARQSGEPQRQWSCSVGVNRSKIVSLRRGSLRWRAGFSLVEETLRCRAERDQTARHVHAILWYAYPMSVFGPALLICALAISWPVFELAAARLIRANLTQHAEWPIRVSPWLRDLGLPYLALMLGAVAARDMGLRGHSLLDWVFGLLLAGGAAALGWRLGQAQGWPESAQAALDEVRWALYRSLAWGWSGSLVVGLLAGFGVSLIERALMRASETGRLRLVREDGPWLVRALTSAALFGVAHNLWLNVFSRLAAPLSFALWRARHGQSADAPRAPRD